VTPNPKPIADLSAIDSRGVGLRIRFVWQGDRYYHQIDAMDGLLSRTLLESVEGDETAAWPPSPFLQQVNISWIASDKEHGHVAMLVGTALNCDWSMCVSAHDGRCYSRDASDEIGLFFDVACRTDEPPEFLGSSYRTTLHSVAVSNRMNCAFVPEEGPGLVVVPQDAELKLEGRRTVSPLLRCQATDIRFAKFPATLRWRYAIRRSSGGPLRIAAKKRAK
jgi:hypothetical protein